jgi:hypothetical protein
MCGETLALGRLSKGEAKAGVKEEEEEEEEVPKLLEFTVKENQEGVYRTERYTIERVAPADC